jgi:anaerobic magnesium-protoporphyrin IX monomethyl ester cyclase
MRILVIQFAGAKRDRPLPRFEPQLGTLLALLRKREHDLSLVGMSHFDLEATKAALARALPQLVYADIAGVCVDAARRTFEYVQQHEFLPIVVGGVYPTVDPAGSLSLPGVQAAAIGEPDASLVTYLERVKDPTVGQTVLGVWMRDERGLARPDLPHLVEDLNSLPFAERDLFDYAGFVQRTGQVEIAVGRGCPQTCAYCINDWLLDIYEGHGTWVRRRSPENVVAEINLLRERYAGVRTVRFLDHAFALDQQWLSSFLQVYMHRCGLPFSCHLRLNAAEADVVRQLAAAGCRQVDVEVISGSDFLRNEIFDMNLEQGQIDAALQVLRESGVAVRAIVYLGAPYESEMSLAETRSLLLRCRPDVVDVRPYHPFPRTRACETSRDNGWLHGRGEEQYHVRRPGIDMPACRAEEVQAFMRRLRAELRARIGEPWWRRWPRAAQGRMRHWLRRSG